MSSHKCGGKCCQRFWLPFTPDQLRGKALLGETANNDPTEYIKAFAMVLPVTEEATGAFYTCLMLTPDGLCGSYENRPNFCRDFPYKQSPCTECGFHPSPQPEDI